MKLAWQAITVCNDDKCRRVLDDDIQASVHEASSAYEHAVVQLLAEKLTENELQAAIDFVRSPPGQAIMAVENGMADDLAQIGHDFSKAVNDRIFQSFCSQEASACARMKGGSATNASSVSCLPPNHHFHAIATRMVLVTAADHLIPFEAKCALPNCRRSAPGVAYANERRSPHNDHDDHGGIISPGFSADL